MPVIAPAFLGAGGGIGALLSSIMGGVKFKDLIPLLPFLLGGLGVGGDQQQEQTTTAPPTGYQSPMLGMLDPAIFESLMRNMQMYGGAGLPGGQSITPPAIADILAHLKTEWPAILQGYKGGAGQGAMPSRINPRMLGG